LGKRGENWDKFCNYKNVIKIQYDIPQGMFSYCFYILCYYIYICIYIPPKVSLLWHSGGACVVK
jgi:hypothetical protein